MSPTLGTCKRRYQTSLHQKQILIKTFEAKQYLEKEEKFELAGVLNTSKKRIESWFKERCCKKMNNGSKQIGN